jgi:hypothetical protein
MVHRIRHRDPQRQCLKASAGKRVAAAASSIGCVDPVDRWSSRCRRHRTQRAWNAAHRQNTCGEEEWRRVGEGNRGSGTPQRDPRRSQCTNSVQCTEKASASVSLVHVCPAVHPSLAAARDGVDGGRRFSQPHIPHSDRLTNRRHRRVGTIASRCRTQRPAPILRPVESTRIVWPCE